jgi:hypothetical protein
MPTSRHLLQRRHSTIAISAASSTTLALGREMEAAAVLPLALAKVAKTAASTEAAVDGEREFGASEHAADSCCWILKLETAANALLARANTPAESSPKLGGAICDMSQDRAASDSACLSASFKLPGNMSTDAGMIHEFHNEFWATRASTPTID